MVTSWSNLLCQEHSSRTGPSHIPFFAGTLLLASLVILAAGPAIVYFGPEDSSAIVIAEYLVAALTVAGGAALFGASKLVKALQS